LFLWFIASKKTRNVYKHLTQEQERKHAKMSYEGYTQVICENGHLFERDCRDDSLCDCGALDAWTNEVDDTNCDAYGIILMKDIKMKSPEKRHVCNECESEKIVEKARFFIPSDKETKALRSYRIDGDFKKILEN
jgi:hypothetical protein